MKHLRELIENANLLETKIVAVVKAEDPDVLKAVKRTMEAIPLKSILIGSRDKIESLLSSLDMDHRGIEIIEAGDPREAVNIGVDMAKQGKVQMLMKGLLSTRDFLKGIVSEDKALVGNNLLSHVAVFECPGREHLFMVTDAAMNINPDVAQKYQILKNSLSVAKSLGITGPKVAILSAVETVNPAISSTTDAAVLCKMAQRDKLSAIVDGPLALDISISKEALQHKGITSPVEGDADILLVPELVSGNILYKSLVYFAGARVAGIVAGARVPIILTSRADSDESKAYSIVMGMIMAGVDSSV
ncbi:MAG: phosphate butyryltransferase [Thermoanaerobacteraceae bacterium]|uniref:Bifunctional enoyl-CoA hydratase/phosphate acetyltransferase n=1 Tax=Biomaibacter acetigenes TaxID=2316383 RepID=A0A3G2R3S4_9FIRM|nr:bifunctional enoyl-CoA hydratase/phosphate acetyltransferase [Biomaibacter acetigenes]AYO30110.1 bifunctional enoyl-CoA hydratase/phosphate acetyltransferase [Biomaibacter acetigenes]MDK2878881.1 phosphate butyryltransferase [Thermoanaerobacteraceae bacterium]MDN5301233.1 phosphate butyryltransferase [Thermoanaerobacteraceae bacterium]